MLACARRRNWPCLWLCFFIPAALGADESKPAPSYSARVINPKLTGSLLEPNSRTLLLWGTDGAVMYSTDGASFIWANTPTDADLSRIAADARGKVLIAVGEHGVIIRSEDAGRHWSSASVPDTKFDLRTVVHHPASGTWIAAGTQGAILRSLDSGRTWTALDHELNVTFQTLFLEPSSNAVLIGGDEGLVGRSTDAGVSWHLTRIRMQEPVTPITTFHSLPGQLIATSAVGRFLTSEDHGASWELQEMGGNAYFTDVVFDPDHRVALMTSHVGDVFRREAGDDVWERVEPSFGGQKKFLSAIRHDARTKSLLVAGHHGMAARSSDGGRTWQQVLTGFETSMESLAQLSDGRYIGFGEGGFICASADSGRNWRVVAPSLNLNLRELVALPKDNVLVASGELGSVLRSVDGGQSWTAIPIAYPNVNTPPELRSLVVADEKTLIAAGAPGTIVRSADAGRTWQVTHWTALEKEEAFPWILNNQRRQRLSVIEARGSMYASNDGGRQWRLSKLATDRELWQGSVLESRGVMLAAGQRGALARSMDNGLTWTAIDTGSSENLFGSYADETSGHLFLLGARGVILRSVDAGVTWSRLVSGTDRALRRMLRDPRTGALIAFGEHGALLRSTDDADSWMTVDSGTDAELRKGLIEPGTGNLVIVGQLGTMLRSVDAGKSWSAIPSHTRRHFRSAAFNPRTGDLIAVGERIVTLTLN
jgi:photosystem II stability/assembly factor-like uncharacterized protein